MWGPKADRAMDGRATPPGQCQRRQRGNATTPAPAPAPNHSLATCNPFFPTHSQAMSLEHENHQAFFGRHSHTVGSGPELIRRTSVGQELDRRSSVGPSRLETLMRSVGSRDGATTQQAAAGRRQAVSMPARNQERAAGLHSDAGTALGMPPSRLRRAAVGGAAAGSSVAAVADPTSPSMLFITFGNTAVWDFTRNWVAAVQRLGLQFVVGALNRGMSQLCDEAGYPHIDLWSGGKEVRARAGCPAGLLAGGALGRVRLTLVGKLSVVACPHAAC